MRQSEKPVIICGAVLLLIAAFFTISVMMQFLNFGAGSPGSNTIFFNLGSVLYQAYGICSILIPIFLFTAAIMLFLPTWSIRRGIYLGASILPFYTLVAAEKLIRLFLQNDSGLLFYLKLAAILVAAILVVTIEYLAIGLIVDGLTSIKKPHPINTNNIDFDNFIEENKSNEVEAKEEEIEHFDNPLAELEKVSFVTEDLSEAGEFEKSEVEVLAEVDEYIETENEPELSYYDENISIEEMENTLKNSIVENPEVENVQESVYIDDVQDVQESVYADDVQDAQESVYADDIQDAQESVYADDVQDAQESVYADDNIKEINFEDIVNDENEVEDTIENEIDSDDENVIDLYDLDVSPEEEPIQMSFSLPPIDILGEERTIIAEESEVDESDDLPVDFDELYSSEEADFIENPFEPDNKRIIASDNESSIKPKKYRIGPYEVPTEGLLQVYPDGEYWVIDDATKEAAEQLKETLNEFKIEAEVTGIRKGPVITMFEILPAPGVKLSKIVALADNIALRLAASSVRIVAPIPGKRAVGIEVPNAERAIVSFKEIIDRDMNEFKKMAIPVVLGKDIAGEAQLLDLAKTPHLLIAGSTGSGKSVCVNSLILSILYKRSPSEVKMILIDPKVVELKLYNDIPHLLTPVITEPKRAFQSLQYCLCEMERRYALLDGMGVRDITSYNKRIVERKIATEKLPYIVVIIDEFADLMATTGKELESTLARLAAMSRAVGIHLVLATQRPSIDVITGLIKANIPTRIAFMVASKMDSRIIIDQVGAEKLLGRGDMLYASAVDPFPVRIQGTFVSDNEVENVVEYVKQFGEPDYIDEEIFVDDDDGDVPQSLFSDGDDPLYDKAVEIVMQAGKASASYIQRRLKIGYNRAARLVEEMEARGLVGPANGSKPREILHVI